MTYRERVQIREIRYALYMAMSLGPLLITTPGIAQAGATVVLRCDEEYSVPIKLTEQPAAWYQWDDSRGTPEWVDRCANSYRTAKMAGCVVQYIPERRSWMYASPESRLGVGNGPAITSRTIEMISPAQGKDSYILHSMDVLNNTDTGEERKSGNKPIVCVKINDPSGPVTH